MPGARASQLFARRTVSRYGLCSAQGLARVLLTAMVLDTSYARRTVLPDEGFACGTGFEMGYARSTGILNMTKIVATSVVTVWLSAAFSPFIGVQG